MPFTLATRPRIITAAAEGGSDAVLGRPVVPPREPELPAAVVTGEPGDETLVVVVFSLELPPLVDVVEVDEGGALVELAALSPTGPSEQPARVSAATRTVVPARGARRPAWVVLVRCRSMTRTYDARRADQNTSVR
ncbi:MAG: hypothetical protein M3N45_04270 [Actinomycetota bacterium]|nr:hypothetical protein [Actinomycetota bacterium]